VSDLTESAILSPSSQGVHTVNPLGVGVGSGLMHLSWALTKCKTIEPVSEIGTAG
jgi:hypothetical protein